MFWGGVFSLCSLCCKRQTMNIMISNDKRQPTRAKFWKKQTVEEPTCRLSFTTFNCLRTSFNFLLCVVLLVQFVDMLATDQQQTAKRQNATSFIFSVSAAGTRSPKDAFRKIYWKCRPLCRLPFYTNPWGDRKTTRRELENCRNWCVWVMKFLFHWQSPLRDPRVASSRACVGPIDACERKLVWVHPTGSYRKTALPIFILNQWSRSYTVS